MGPTVYRPTTTERETVTVVKLKFPPPRH